MSDSESESVESLDDLRIGLGANISQVQSFGSFAACSEIHPFPNPGLFVKGVGLLSLPLSEDKADALIGQSHQAPCGVGQRTVVDESIRNTWEIDAAEVEFHNKRWEEDLGKIINQAAESLGVNSRVTAQLHKMLLYGKGQMFAPHRDTEKTPAMFATLVICLPSQHTGGEVKLRHNGEEKTFETEGTSQFGGSFLTWYTNVPHEILPVTSGYRWVLVYNLCHASTEKPEPSAERLDGRLEALVSLLESWSAADEQYKSLCWPLQHSYSNAGLEWHRLKGTDRYQARHIEQACAKKKDFFCFLANLEHTRSFPSADEDWRHNVQEEMKVSRMIDSNDIVLGEDFRAHCPTSIYPTTPLRHRCPDAQYGGEYLGNQGSEIEQIYRDSVLIIAPSIFIRSLLPASSDLAERFVHRLIARIRDDADEPCHKALLDCWCQSTFGTSFKKRKDQASNMAVVAMAAVFFAENSRLDKAVSKSPLPFESGAFKNIGQYIRCDKHHEIEPFLSRAIKHGASFDKVQQNVMALWTGFSEKNEDRNNPALSDYIRAWVRSIVYDTLITSDSSCREDAATAVQLIADSSALRLHRFVMYQGVKRFAHKFSSDPPFITAFAIELYSKVEDPTSADATELQALIKQLLGQITLCVACHFDLQTYASYNKDATRLHGVNKAGICSPLEQVYKCALSQSHDTALVLLGRINSQLFNLKIQEEVLLSLMTDLTIYVDTSLPFTHPFLKQFFFLVLRHNVKEPPREPKDWKRDMDWSMNCKYCRCEACRDLTAFVQDPVRRAHSVRDYQKITCNAWKDFWEKDRFLQVDQSKGGEILEISKTYKEWEESKTTWTTGALGFIGKMEARVSSEGCAAFLQALRLDVQDWDRVLQLWDSCTDKPQQSSPLKRGYDKISP